MNIRDRFKTLLGHNPERIQKNGIYEAKVVHPGLVQKFNTVCCICEKTFTPDKNGIHYFYSADGCFNIMCPKCYQKYLDAFTVMDCEAVVPDVGLRGTGIIMGCRMKDGSIIDMPYGTRQTIFGEIPSIFEESSRPFRQHYLDEQKKLYINKLEVVETWDKQQINVSFMSGDEYIINYKSTTDGIICNPDDVKQLKQEQIDKVNLKLKERGYKFFVQ